MHFSTVNNSNIALTSHCKYAMHFSIFANIELEKNAEEATVDKK
jgi:hypothetical protein